MSRQNKRAADIGFAALSIEGGLIAPEQVVTIASATPDLKTAAEYGCPKGTTLREEITRYFRIAQAHWQSYARLEEPSVSQTAAFAESLGAGLAKLAILQFTKRENHGSSFQCVNLR